MHKRQFLAACAASALSRAAFAQSWPSKPLRLIVPFPAGGAADLFARLVAQEISQSLGQPVVVDNKAGAGGNIGAREASLAQPDGNTLFLGTVGTNAINPTLYGNLPYDPRKAFIPVALTGSLPNVLVVSASSPVKSVAELTALAKSKPGRLNMGSSGNGSSIHLSGELYKHMAGVHIVHIPYRGGAPALTDLIAGQVDLMFDNLPTSLPHIRKGALRPLAVTGQRRSPQLPDVPTMIESGMRGYESTAWAGIFVPAGTAGSVVTRLNAEIVRALGSERIVARYREMGAEAALMRPHEFKAFTEAEYDKWAKVVKLAGARPE